MIEAIVGIALAGTFIAALGFVAYVILGGKLFGDE